MERNEETPLHSEFESKLSSGATAKVAYLHLVYSPNPAEHGLRFVLHQGKTFVLGRENEGADPGMTGLSDGRLSRRHFELLWSHGGPKIRDLGSKNGTRVNGEPIPPHNLFYLSGGEVIRASDTVFVFRLDPCPQGDIFRENTELMGSSPEIVKLRFRVEQMKSSVYPVLILGETGTGKEHLARAIHRSSAHAKGDFIAVNCAELSPSLGRAELFGAEKGAFTDAKDARNGLVQNAAHGTLFLDEIGELHLEVQAELLRFLQTNKFRRVGGAEELQSSARIVAATNVDIEQASLDGRFRRDLLARLREYHSPLQLPPIRQRPEDILNWMKVFNKNLFPSWLNKGSQVETLLCARWPDNLRALRQVVQEGRLPEIEKKPAEKSLKEARQEVTHQEAIDALSVCQGNVKLAAEKLGMERTRFYRACKRMGIEVDMFRRQS